MGRTIQFLFLTSDVISLFLSYFIAYILRFNVLYTMIPLRGEQEFIRYIKIFLVSLPFLILSNVYVRAYSRNALAMMDEFFRVIKASIIYLLFVLFLIVFVKFVEISRVVMMLQWFIFIFLSFLLRSFIKLLFKFPPEKILVVGNEEILFRIAKKFLNVVIDVVDDVDESRILQYKKIFWCKRVSDLIKLSKMSDMLEEQGIELYILPGMYHIRPGEITIKDFFGIPFLRIFHPSLSGYDSFIKSIFDITLATFLCGVFFLPAMLIAFAIVIDSDGGVLYTQKRRGYKGRVFNFYKFRTMYKDADKMLEKLITKSDRPGPVFKLKNDPRITKVGRILRRFSMDEIPQFIHVLKGQMSIVGPRPVVLYEAKNFDETAKRRMNLLPGITGLWQVSGRADLGYEDMIYLDLFYIEHWSLGFDMKIILKTIPVILSGRGAY